MDPTNVGHPNYYHRVVDCQWACPAHTNVPEYIRLIAQGRYTDAYMLNRESNVFPGILGRTCDRPCEPACRRGRVDGKPVAICRLKRVAADNRGEVKHLLPTAPADRNGKKIALIGAGPASLTVANDLVPLGYHCTIFEKLPRPGGLMRINIPAFRLPAQVLDEEIAYIIDMGVDVRYDTPVDSLKGLLDRGEFDAVFVGSGAPKGKELEIPGRYDTDQIFIGIEWLESIHFGHVDSVGKRVLIIGVGNTAMDCCRSSKRLGATDVKVIARKTRKYFKASPWELEDAEEEGVEILENLQPVRFIIENGKLTGMEFDRFKSIETEKGLKQEVIGREILPCDTVVLAIGQDNAFPFIERDIGLEFGKWDMPVVDKTTFMSTRPGVFFGGDAAFGPANIIWAVEHGHQAAISIHNYCHGVPLTDRPPQGMTLASTKMGLHEWAYSNDYNAAQRQKMMHVELPLRFASMTTEVEKGFTAEQTLAEVERCLNCDVETHFIDALCIECDACIDICPVDCLTIVKNGEEPQIRESFRVTADNLDQPVFVSGPLKQTGRVMAKDENVCLHCGLCAERCPTYAWDMRKFVLEIPYAGSLPVSRSPLPAGAGS
jgi:NADPH-dependent glutamate synthase beta subunit-like oxidoreductase/ferredoxin